MFRDVGVGLVVLVTVETTGENFSRTVTKKKKKIVYYSYCIVEVLQVRHTSLSRHSSSTDSTVLISIVVDVFPEVLRPTSQVLELRTTWNRFQYLATDCCILRQVLDSIPLGIELCDLW